MISSRLTRYLSHSVNQFLYHRYTLIKYEDTGNEDDEGQTIYVPGIPATGRRCLFLWQEVSQTTDEGTVISKAPVLYVANTDNIAENDLIEDVISRSGVTLLSSAKVNTIDTTAEGGNPLLKVCRLEGARIG